MTSYKSAALALLLGMSAGGCAAFVPQPKASGGIGSRCSETTTTTSALHAFTPPTLIIGPMLKRMRAEKERKNAPLALDEEMAQEAPGLRVGTGAWKWPPVWPYDGEAFMRPAEIVNVAQQSAMQGMLGMGGMPALPESPTDLPEVDKLDVKKYWGEEVADVATGIDEEAAEKLRSHYSYYLRDGMSVLELGAAEDSYLPQDLKLGRHVGIGLSKAQMDRNSALTEKLVVDLNEVDEDVGIASEEVKQLGANTFDIIIMANTIDFLENPREVYKTAWQLLKPGGIMMAAFTSRDAYADKFGKAQTKMWKDMNDDQHMWIAGSFFQFSAGDGWGSLKGFDISPEGVKMDDGNPMAKLMNRNKGMPMYVVQATKEAQDEEIDENDPEKSIKTKMWTLPTMEERDKMLVAPRLARAFEAARSEEEKRAIGEHVDTLPKVYESLIKMDQFAFTFSMQAQLAADLARDQDFVANEDQIAAMKMGLGLRTPSKEFWEPLGMATAAMDPEDKVNLLAHVVPRFGSGNPEQDAALEAFVAGLTPTFDTIRSKCPSMSEADVQLVGSELLAAEVLPPESSTRKEFAAWLGAMSESELNDYLSRRKSFKETALADMKTMQEERAAEKARVEEERQKMIEQARKAREERTMAFNPETGKMEEIKKKD